MQGAGNRHRAGGGVGTSAVVRRGEGWQTARRSSVSSHWDMGIAGALVVACPWTEEGAGEGSASWSLTVMGVAVARGSREACYIGASNLGAGASGTSKGLSVRAVSTDWGQVSLGESWRGPRQLHRSKQSSGGVESPSEPAPERLRRPVLMFYPCTGICVSCINASLGRFERETDRK